MYWYLPRENPHDILKRIALLRSSGQLEQMNPDEQLALAKELDSLNNAAGKNFYICTPEQKLYKWFLMPHMIRGIIAGNRAGKSAACCMDVIMQAEGWHPLQKKNLQRLAEEAVDEWVREHCKKLLLDKKWIKDPPIKARCVCTDFDNAVDKGLGPEYKLWISHDLVKSIDYDHEKKRSIIWQNNSSLEFLTLKQDLEAHMSVARHVVQFEEEPYITYFEENLMRLISTNGRALISMTNVAGMTWTEQAIWEPGLKGQDDVYAIKLKTSDNPVNKKSSVDRIKKFFSDSNIAAIRFEGDIVSRGGSVFNMWKNEHPWIVQEQQVPDTGLLILSIDPHLQTAHGGTWVWVDFEGIYHPLHEGKPNLYLVAGFFLHGHVPFISSVIKAKEGFIGREHDICICDPYGWVANQAEYNSKTFVDQLNDNGIYPIKGSKDLMGGIVKMGEMLSLEWKGKAKRERPQFMIMDTGESREEGVGRFRWEMKNYRWQTTTLSARDQHIKPKPVDRDDHLIESARRTIEYVYDAEYENIDVSDMIFGRMKYTQNGKELLMPEKMESKWTEMGM